MGSDLKITLCDRQPPERLELSENDDYPLEWHIFSSFSINYQPLKHVVTIVEKLEIP